MACLYDTINCHFDKAYENSYNSPVIRRWNLTIILIVTAFVLGVVSGYTYRDRFSWLLPNTAELERTEPDIEQAIFEAEIKDILRPDTGAEAADGSSEIYDFTGRVRAIATDGITVEEPDGTIDFILTETTRYATVEFFTNADGAPDTKETPLTYSDITLDNLVVVYTVEDIRTASERHVILVQKLNNQ